MLTALLLASTAASRAPRQLPPGPLILGYSTACDDGSTAVAEARAGVNVINWFAANLVGGPAIAFPRNTSCIANTARALKAQGLRTAHMLTVGGWNAPHPNRSLSGRHWAEEFHRWNEALAAEGAWAGFDGLDWDLEGNDAQGSRWNRFTAEGMELVGTMSQRLKALGYLVTLVPPQSYFDVGTQQFGLDLRYAPADPGYHQEFRYAGRNSYALLEAKYGMTTKGATFDLIDVQLYESWSRADYQINGRGVAPEAYLAAWVRAITAGWVVRFDHVPEVGLPATRVSVPPSRLVVGLSFGSGDRSGKSVFIRPAAVGRAFAALPEALRPRGAMFWNMQLEGSKSNGTEERTSFAKGLNAFLRTRS